MRKTVPTSTESQVGTRGGRLTSFGASFARYLHYQDYEEHRQKIIDVNVFSTSMFFKNIVK